MQHFEDSGEESVVVKSQILAGGRGMGTFKNGLQGGVHITKPSEAVALAKRMLGQVLVTKQTGPAGKPVNTLFLVKKMTFAREMVRPLGGRQGTPVPVCVPCPRRRARCQPPATLFSLTSACSFAGRCPSQGSPLSPAVLRHPAGPQGGWPRHHRLA